LYEHKPKFKIKLKINLCKHSLYFLHIRYNMNVDKIGNFVKNLDKL